MAEYCYGQSASLFCCPSICAQALRAAIVAAELPLRGKLRAEATTVFIDQRFLEVMKKEANNRQLAMVGLCVGLSGLLSWVAWHMYSVGQHVPHHSHTISMLLNHDELTCLFRLREYLRRLGCLFSVVGFYGVQKGGWFLGCFLACCGCGFPTRLGDRRDRPCRDPLRRESGRYAITIITGWTRSKQDQWSGCRL